MRTSWMLIAILLAACSAAPSSSSEAPAPDQASHDAGFTPPIAARSDAGAADDAAVTATCASSSLAPGDYDRTIDIGGRERVYHVHVPPGASGKAAPLLFGFHGGGHTAAGFEAFAHLAAKSDTAGFILVEPEGIGAIGASADGVAETWNAGSCCVESVTENVDDVGFVRAMLDAIAKEACVDLKRVYSTGFSNGGMLSHRLACELSDRIAAIAPVSGGLGRDDRSQMPPKPFFTCAPKRHVPVMHVHGTADACYPFDGGRANGGFTGLLAPVVYEPVSTTIATWAKLNGCSDAQPTVTSKNGAATCKSFACPEDGAVVLCTIDGGGHYWPGGDDWPGSEILCGSGQGTRSADLASNDRIWEFLSAHALP